MLSNRAIKQVNKSLVPTWQVKQIGNKLQIFLTHFGCNLNLWIQGNSLFLKSSLFSILSYTLGDKLLWKTKQKGHCPMKTLSTCMKLSSHLWLLSRISLTQTIASSQMTLESLKAIAIATLNDWLKNLAPVFQPMRSKTKSYIKTINWDDRETISVRRSCVPLFWFKSLAVFFVSAWCSLRYFRVTIFVLWGGRDAFDSQTCQKSFFLCRDHQRQIVKLLYWDFFLLCVTSLKFLCVTSVKTSTLMTENSPVAGANFVSTAHSTEVLVLLGYPLHVRNITSHLFRFLINAELTTSGCATLVSMLTVGLMAPQCRAWCFWLSIRVQR